MKLSTAIKLVHDELERAAELHGPMTSPHEGYAVLLEEVDELWAEVKANNGTSHRATSEAVQVAAMSLRYLLDLCPEESAIGHETKVQTHFASHERGGYSG